MKRPKRKLYRRLEEKPETKPATATAEAFWDLTESIIRLSQAYQTPHGRQSVAFMGMDLSSYYTHDSLNMLVNRDESLRREMNQSDFLPLMPDIDLVHNRTGRISRNRQLLVQEIPNAQQRAAELREQFSYMEPRMQAFNMEVRKIHSKREKLELLKEETSAKEQRKHPPKGKRGIVKRGPNPLKK